MLNLAQCRWIREHENCIIVGATGVGKSYLACALAHKACREGYRATYIRTPRLFDDLTLPKADGRYRKLLAAYAKHDLDFFLRRSFTGQPRVARFALLWGDDTPFTSSTLKGLSR